MADRRDAQRVPVALRAQFRGAGLVVDGIVEDVSRTGLFLRTTATDALGTPGHIELDVPDEPNVVRLEAKVVRIIGSDHGGEHAGIGLQFEDGSRDARRPLANLMMRWAQQGNEALSDPDLP